MITKITEIKKDAIKAAAKDFNDWQGKAAIHLDLSDGQVWTDVMTGTEVISYRSKSVICVYCKDDFTTRDLRISPERLTRVLDKVLQSDILGLDEMDRYNALQDAVLETLD